MIELVIDASVTAAWCFEDEETEYAKEVLRRAQEITLFVPVIWPVEMVNVLLVNERRKRITPADTERALKLLKELAIQVDPFGRLDPFDKTLSLARTYALSSYDACYLELAMRESLPLATLDNRLRTAATAAGVRLFL